MDPRSTDACSICPECESWQGHDAMSGVSCAHIHAALIHESGGLLGDGLQADEDLPIGDEIGLCASPTGDIAGPSNVQEENLYAMEEDDAPSSFDIKKQAFNEIETYLSGLKSNLLTILKTPDESSTEKMLEMAACIKNKYHESSMKARKYVTHTHRKLPRRIELPAVGRLPNHTPIRLLKRSTVKTKQRRQARESNTMYECEVDDMQICVVCYRRVPRTNEDFDDWVKCSSCGMWAHEACAEVGSTCPHDDGHFQYCELPN